MCGIVGTAGEIPDFERRQRALDSMHRRGPDSRGEWIDPDGLVWLGNRRLAIIDPGPDGAQPMVHPDSADLVVTYNGEIYNFPELKDELERGGHRFRTNCDTELLLHGYRAWGTALLDRIEGMFAFALYDRRKKIVFLARDPVGQKPLYFCRSANRLDFASTSAELRCLNPAINRLSGTGLCHLLTHGYVPNPFSIWEGVEALPPGHFAMWQPGNKLRITRYWGPPAELGDRYATLDEFTSIFPTVCAEHSLSDVPIGLLLSGGLDSSSVARALTDAGKPLRCFTLGFGEDAASETPIASETARYLGLPLNVRDLPDTDVDDLRRKVAVASPEPQARSGLLTMYAVAEQAAAELKVVISGDGGDEAFGGYRWYLPPRPSLRRSVLRTLDRWRGDSAAETGIASRRSFERFSARSPLHAHALKVSQLFLPFEAAALFAPLAPDFSDEAMLAPLKEHFVPTLPIATAMQRVDLMTFCSASILAKVDRMSMAHSLEVRAPFLDRRILDWAMSRRFEAPARGRQKKILREFLAGRVPQSVLAHKKQGFSLRGLKNYDHEKLAGEISRSRLVSDGILRPDFVRYVGPESFDKARKSRLWALSAIADWYEAHA